MQPKRREKPACNHHKAGNELSVRGMVDFFKGERFMYSDYALGSLLSHLNKRRGGSAPIGITYDVFCHWIVNFATRAKSLPPSISISDDLDLVGAIPKWHLIGHERQCYIRWSLDNTPHVGRMDGEAPERFWSHLNQSSGSTSEQGPGVRTDSLNNIVRVWNEEKAFNMHKSTPLQYDQAKKQLAKQKEEHLRLTKGMPDAKIQEWENESAEPVQGPNKKWSSVVMDPILEGGFHETVKEGRQKETPTAHAARKRPGVTRWLADGIELEHAIQKFNNDAEELGDSPTPLRATQLNIKRLSLRAQVESHQKRREVFMNGVEESDKPRVLRFYEEDAEDEVLDFGMPSSYAPDTLKSAGLESLAKLEMELRRAICKESLESVKRLLTTKQVTQKVKHRHVQGQVPNTRVNAKLTAQDIKISKAQWRYANSRQALIHLGLSESDADFPELKSSDLEPLSVYFDKYATSVGHGYSTGLSWIWKSTVAPNTSDWEINALKTEWFRSRERFKRWEEHLFILKREMVMTIRSFQRFQDLWEWKSAAIDVTPGMKAYACGRAKFFAELAKRMLEACHKQLYDETVEFKWCINWLRDNVIVNGKSVTLIKR
ncbi:hypothetical protein BDV93DRAFT_558839 [Ceratobasidium sp. AG-I]|nr:hypothetical protein BDV93DRAFT_558839 [Ceratobasidium sp. AG-I]